MEWPTLKTQIRLLLKSSLIWVYTICTDLCVQKFRIIMVLSIAYPNFLFRSILSLLSAIEANFFSRSLGIEVKRCWWLVPSWRAVPRNKTFKPRHDKTNKVSVRPAKTQISQGIRPVWSESSLCAQWVAKDPRFLHADSEGSDQTGRIPRLI